MSLFDDIIFLSALLMACSRHIPATQTRLSRPRAAGQLIQLPLTAAAGDQRVMAILMALVAHA